MIEESFVLNKNTTEVNTDKEIRNFSSSSAFLMDMIIRILIHNRDRIMLLWDSVSLHINYVFAPATPPVLIDRVATGLFRLMMRLVHSAVLYSLNSIE